jgi:hypothetical protein
MLAELEDDEESSVVVTGRRTPYHTGSSSARRIAEFSDRNRRKRTFPKAFGYILKQCDHPFAQIFRIPKLGVQRIPSRQHRANVGHPKPERPSSSFTTTLDRMDSFSLVFNSYESF